MQDTDFFSWLRTMLLRFQRMEAAEEVYHEIELQAQQLEYDYYSLCVRHPVPFTRPKVAFTPITLSRGLVIIRQKFSRN